MDLTADTAESVFEALGSETARSILAALEDDPATASDLADRVETSLQNVQYHLGNLEAADLVAEVGTWYSSRGTEMTVYAPTFDRLEFTLTDGADDDLDSTPTGPTVASPAANLND
ncbi:MAG: ArsR/SmtB family transcription factor [Halobacteriales archaeon]